MARKILNRVGFAALIAVATAWLPLGTADAARPRPISVVEQRDPNPIPSTPEPAGAIVFGIGVGLVVWKLRRARKTD